MSQCQLGRPCLQVSVAHLRPLQEPNRVVRGEPEMLEHAVCACYDIMMRACVQ